MDLVVTPWGCIKKMRCDEMMNKKKDCGELRDTKIQINGKS